MEEPITLRQIEYTLSGGPDVSKMVQGVIDQAQRHAIEIVKQRWVEQHLDDPNNWPSVGHALQAWFDEVHATMRVLLGLV